MKIVGHTKQRALLRDAAFNNRLHHSLLFNGTEGVGKKLVALELASLILNTSFDQVINHPDLYLLKPEGKLGLHSIQSLRVFSEEVYLSPYKAERKVFIIEDADRMQPAAANALLKTFEEPSEYAIIVLLSHSINELLPTILSRCQAIHFNSLSYEEIVDVLKNQWKIESDQIDQIAFLSEGSLAMAKRLLDQGFSELQKKFLKLVASLPSLDKIILRDQAKEFAELFEERKDEREKSLRKNKERFLKESSALTQELLEKEIEGELALETLNDFKHFLKIFLSWLRDVYLLSHDKKCNHLIYEREREDIANHVDYFEQRGGPPSFATVEQHIQNTILGFERQLKTATCLETLFVKTYT